MKAMTFVTQNDARYLS